MWSTWIVTSRPVGWTGMALGRAAVVVARSAEEAEGQAIVDLGLRGRRIIDAERARGVMGTGEAERQGMGNALWLSTGQVDFSDNAAVYGVRLGELMEGYEEARRLNALEEGPQLREEYIVCYAAGYPDPHAPHPNTLEHARAFRDEHRINGVTKQLVDPAPFIKRRLTSGWEVVE